MNRPLKFLLVAISMWLTCRATAATTHATTIAVKRIVVPPIRVSIVFALHLANDTQAAQSAIAQIGDSYAVDAALLKAHEEDRLRQWIQQQPSASIGVDLDWRTAMTILTDANPGTRLDF